VNEADVDDHCSSLMDSIVNLYVGYTSWIILMSLCLHMIC